LLQPAIQLQQGTEQHLRAGVAASSDETRGLVVRLGFAGRV